jgi:hypothetical protein
VSAPEIAGFGAGFHRGEEAARQADWDLHLEMIHSLFAVGIQLQATAALTDDDLVANRLGQAIAQLDRCIAGLRGHLVTLDGIQGRPLRRG